MYEAPPEGPCLSVLFFSPLSLKGLQFPNQARFALHRDSTPPLHFITESFGSWGNGGAGRSNRLNVVDQAIWL